jgi:hypothetical protein
MCTVSEYVHLTSLTSLVVEWSGFLTTDHEVPGSIPGSTMGIFLEGEDSSGDHGVGSLVELRLRRLLVLHIHISPSTSSGQRNCASWASQPQKSVTLRPQWGGETTKSIRGMWWHWGGGEH